VANNIRVGKLLNVLPPPRTPPACVWPAHGSVTTVTVRSQDLCATLMPYSPECVVIDTETPGQAIRRDYLLVPLAKRECRLVHLPAHAYDCYTTGGRVR